MSDITVTTGDGISVEIIASPAPSITVTEKGPKGDTGATGATGATGPGLIAGGTANEFLQKNSATDYDTKWSAYTLPAADGTERQVLSTDGAGTLSFGMPVAEHVHLLVRNDEGATINAGTPIYSKGEIGGSDRILVGIADASDPARMPAIGIAETTLNTTDAKDGHGIITGVFNTNVSGFTGLSEGDILYVSNSGGGLSQTKPTGTYLIQNVGIVLKTNGTILQGLQVSCIGRTNDVPNIPNGQTWIGNASGVATPTTLATVATSGSYNDLSDQPTIPTDTNLGNSDQTLSAERTVEMSANAVVFDNSSVEVARIFPQGYIRATGRSIINGNGSIGGQVILKDADSSNGVTLQGPLTVGSDLTLTLPDADGSSGEVLKTNGSGVLSFGQAASRGGTYSYSGYATDVTKTATFYYQFPSATATSSSTDMISGFVGQSISQGTWGANGAMTLDGLSSTDSATYSMTIKVTTNTTIAIQTLSLASGQFVPATQFAFSNPSEQTFTLTQTSPTACLSQAGNQWMLGLSVTFFAGGSIDFRVEDLSITVS